MMLNRERTRAERRKRLRWMALALVLFAVGFSLSAYFLLPPRQRESYYMMSTVFLSMAFFCLIAKPRR